jgi:serine phosphatase RsbU (regulator of sigma subunit)
MLNIKRNFICQHKFFLKNLFVFWISVCVFSLPKVSFSQNKERLDSLLNELKISKDDSTRLLINLAICDENNWKNTTKNLLHYSLNALKLADLLEKKSNSQFTKNYFLTKKAQVYNHIADYYEKFGKSDSLKPIYFKKLSLSIYQKLNDTTKILKQISNIGYYYQYSLYNYPLALEYYNRGLELEKKYAIKDSDRIFISSIATLHKDIGQYDDAIQFYLKSIEISMKLKDTIQTGNLLVWIAKCYSSKGDFTKAEKYYKSAISTYKKVEDKNPLGWVWGWLGNLYLKYDRLDSALGYQNKCLLVSKELNHIGWIVNALNSIGNIYLKKQEFNKAKDYYSQALLVAEKFMKEDSFGGNKYLGETSYNFANFFYKIGIYSDAKKNIIRSIDCFEKRDYFPELSAPELLASKIDSALGNGMDALKHYQKYIFYRDKLKNQEAVKALISDKYQKDYEKRKVSDDAKNLIESNKQKTIKNILFAIIASTVFIILVVYRSYKLKQRDNRIIEKQKAEVEHQKQEILDSIEYAKRIQTTILPPPKVVKKYLDDSFILYLPKDIVAGDFYWMESVGDWVLFAACDCTGHGVPGALVSVVCHNALNRAVKEYNKIMPAEILDVVAELVLENFSTDDDVKDGMDASVCALNTATGELYWAGANNPLWLIKNNELLEYKPNKQPIGKFDDRVPYTNHKIEITKGDTIYLFTDGYADQFGGERAKKLTKAKFKEAILNIQRNSLDEQKKYLLDLHLNYKGSLGQVDDICVIGVRV